MTSLSFPDLNVWLALIMHDHVHSMQARRWWKQTESRIAFHRRTQMGILRLLTTVAAMAGEPLTMAEAWSVYERFYDDDRVCFLGEPIQVDALFKKHTEGYAASPKVWADAWLLAFAQASGGRLITFDHALTERGACCLL